MRDFAQQARTALVVYLERGRKAVHHAECGELEECMELMRLRKAAFHNFRAADGALQAVGVNLADAPEFQRLAGEIVEHDQALVSQLQKLRETVRKDLIRSKKVRQSIGKYRSRRQSRSDFIQAI